MSHDVPHPDWYNRDKEIKVVVRGKVFTLPPLRPPVRKSK